MNPLERLVGASVAVMLAAGVWIGVHRYGAEQYDAGYTAAVDVGNKQRARAAYLNQQTEDEMRALLAAKDADAHRKEQEYASNLADAQRRVRAGTDRLRCPSASTVQPAAAAGDRPAAAGPSADTGGTELVPDAAEAILGDGATIAGLVRKFDRLTERFEKCRAVNAK